MPADRIEHYIRTALITLLLLAVGGAWLFGDLEESVAFRLEGLLYLLVPATLDALRVALKHQRFETAARARDSERRSRSKRPAPRDR